jgi:hypothetical protein
MYVSFYQTVLHGSEGKRTFLAPGDPMFLYALTIHAELVEFLNASVKHTIY